MASPAQIFKDRRIVIIAIAVMVVIAVIVACILLWNPISIFVSSLNYSDEGRYAGEPVFNKSGTGISRTLYVNLRNCGMQQEDLDSLSRALFNLRSNSLIQTTFDNNGKALRTINAQQISGSVFLVKCTAVP